jgi:hypothetical protein
MSDYRVSKTANANLYFTNGDTFYFSFSVKYNDVAIDLSIYTRAKMQVKENEFSDPLINFTHTGITYNIDITNASAGQITITAPSIVLANGTYIYDLQLSNSNTIETIMSGNIILENQVTT